MTPAADGHDSDFARIFGVETEYGLSVTGAARRYRASDLAMLMFRPIISSSRSTNVYLGNGARLYLDVGSHPEYATAEACTPMDATAQDTAGERIRGRLALNAQRRLRSDSDGHATVHLFKNNVDSAGHSFGCHENYLLRRVVPLSAVDRELIPFLVTRQLFAGAGRVTDSGFELSQRADFLDDAVSSSTTRSRPMVNTRDEPHADPKRFRRLHVIVGDSNRSPTATWLKLATTHLVLCIIEEHSRSHTASPLAGYALANPGGAIRAVSRDMSGSVMLTLADQAEHGRAMSALQIQRGYCETAQAFVAAHADAVAAALPDADRVLRLWSGALDAIASGNWRSLSSWVDWAAKLRLLQILSGREASYGIRGRSDAREPALARRLDMDYHDVVNGVTFTSLQRHRLITAPLDDGRIHEAETAAPPHTRAQLRADFVRRASASKQLWSCDWTHLTVRSPRRREIVLENPFDDTRAPDYNALLALLR